MAERSLAFIKKVLQSPWYVELFGDQLHGARADHLSTIQGGNVYGEGRGGALTGKGAGLKRPAGGAFIVDDANKPDEALSQTEAAATRQWAETTAKSRRNSDRWCPFVVSGQRLGPGDLPAYFLDKYPDQTFRLKFPTLVDPKTGEASTADDAISIAPETIRTVTLQSMKRDRIGRFVLASQYQQEPVSLGGNIIVTDEFRWYDLSASCRFYRKVITCDTAFTKKQENDWCVLQCWGQLEDTNNAYLIDEIRGHWESPMLLKEAATFWAKHNADTNWPVEKFLIEEATAGPGLMQQLAQLGVPTEGLTRVKDKAARVQDVLPYLSNGLVFLPGTPTNHEAWLECFLEECAAFTQAMTHANDDQVDCMVDGIQELLGGTGGILSMYGGN
jgi:predicted phage terminase large subunit-like protein